ncbi:carbohydrate sulfotransferase 15-like [Mercenaria mercenaria]|uniref:carbohydrate sulfotransferase 15-like n=1 Tax=Mercenaria mercenaria TaxID=6596 RepID=UPI00234F1CE6|nr:carbohydrate sulfotransferase 15-like [Mercenaria mercenaria]XP_053407713.1 carbohydrate sulfotransferase 15-like [Mercenaria mercenaria]XP_053407714.1 carbohydrate sulfotransferase 15-like [Mercenaria mercenaria]
MTYGPTIQWRFPFQEKLELRKPDFRVVFISLCLVVGLIILISFSYYSSLSVTFTSDQFQTHSTDVGRFTKSNVSRLKVSFIVEEDDSSETSEVTTKEIEEVFTQLNFSIVSSSDYETEKGHLETQSESLEADDGLNATLGTSSVLEEGFNWNDSRLDILHMSKIQYDTRFKNPCWYEPLQSSHPYENNTYAPFSPSAKRVLAKMTRHWEDEFLSEDKPSRLRCLPYFLIIGQPKCGTTDLFWKIAKHPDIEAPPIKELHWWSRSRQGRRFSYSKIIPFNDYVDMFDRAALHIEQRLHNTTSTLEDSTQNSNVIVGNDDINITQKITGEASVSLFWDNNEWMKFPENRGQREPVYIVPHYVHHIIPDAKLIIMLRDPVERMYSDYLYFHSTNKSADDFHSAVKLAISLYSNCTSKYSVRQCIYDTNLSNKVRARLRIGMYSVYLKDWLTLFPLTQFFILRLEDYSRNPVKYVKQIYRFLNIRDITKEEEELVLTSPGRNARKPEDQLLGGMHEKTRILLSDFYQPYNQELAQIIGNTKFLWTDVKH